MEKRPMRSTVRGLITLLFVAAGLTLAVDATATVASTRSDVRSAAAVAKVVNDFQHALSSGDSITALHLLADDAVVLESGDVETRSEYRSHHLPVDIEFAKTVASKRSPLQIRVKGSVAWTARTSTAKGQFKGKAVNSAGAESMILTKEAAGWRIRSIHWSSHKR
jgi:ketosteroid isomerase-like protein